MASTLTVRSRHVVTPHGVESAVVRVEDGRIAALTPGAGAGAGTLDLGDAWLLPGLVDTHVHINEPGRTEWEGFETATRAAAAGGVTTLVDMPLNSIPATTTVTALREKIAAAAGKCRVDVGFWGGVVPGNARELDGLAAAGALGFKCFLAPSGVDEFHHVGEGDLRAAMPVIARLGLPLLAHAESPRALDADARESIGGDPRRYATWLCSRPREAEHEAIALLIRLCRETGCRVHVVHLSSADAVPALRDARAGGLPITVETCPHYLGFDSGEIEDGRTEFKCAPPIRERENRERLWSALREGVIDLVATDHSPCPPAMKEPGSGNFMTAWGGIASLELALAAVWTEARTRGFTPADLARWMSAGPARLAGLEGTKGAIAVGHDADLVVFDPDTEFVVDAARLCQRHPVTPYAGRRLAGRIERVYLRGTCAFDGANFPGPATGRLLLGPAGRAPVDASGRRP
jgi:allantoinase